ncbi:hypothetical protein PVK06_005074 [Gossypium arboreum]|uniref:RNase H type-1 domain-containing protein n=1 Tax=Gossypium arboreum TaxID=29729 RepID=A0ABR0QUL8_GOSAR|nr:hypothetical protein PVK06_005074 [Gossypium arboreum]
MGACSRLTCQVPTAFAVEALAVIHGLRFAFELGFQSVILEGDSRLVIHKLVTSLEDFSEISALIWEVKEFSKLFEVCRCICAAKLGNMAAHAMAQDGLTRREDRFWVEETPLLVVAVADEGRRLLDPP